MADVLPVIIDGVKKREYNPLVDCIPNTNDQSGMYFVPGGTSYLVKENFQAVNFGLLHIEGDLLVDGQLMLEV